METRTQTDDARLEELEAQLNLAKVFANEREQMYAEVLLAPARSDPPGAPCPPDVSCPAGPHPPRRHLHATNMSR